MLIQEKHDWSLKNLHKEKKSSKNEMSHCCVKCIVIDMLHINI